jgi:dCTP deaminase
VLIDRQILEAIEADELLITPREGYLSRIQPASLDVRLGNTFAVYRRQLHGMVDPKEDSTSHWRTDEIADDGHYVVHPGELVLAATYESIGLPDHLVARVEGKSSLGRLGILVHATAGFIDPGWALAPITLEISTVIGVPVMLYPHMPIAQLAFEQIEPVAMGYSGKYVGQGAPTPSRYHENWTGSRWA